MPLFQVPSSSVVDDFPGVNDSAKGDTQHNDQNMFFQSCLEEDPLFAHQVQSLERMLRVRDRLASGALHSRCGNGGGACPAPASRHALALPDSDEDSGGSSLAHCDGPGLSDSVDVSVGASRGAAHPVSDSDSGFVCPARRSGPCFPSHARATASGSTGIIGSLGCASLLNSDNSSMGVACVESALPAVAPFASVLSSPCPFAARVAAAVHARRTVSPMHDVNARNSWSDTGSFQGPRGRKRVKEWGFPVWPKICVLSQRWRQG